MDRPIKILHIDTYYKVTYFINRPGSLIRSLVPTEDVINLLKTEQFDLILSEPHSMAILTPQGHMDFNLITDPRTTDKKRSLMV